MAWVTPITWTLGQMVTYSQLNVNIRDNMNETSTAKATVAGGYYVATAANTIVERVAGHAYTNATDTTTSTSYVDLDGGANPILSSLSTGAKAFVFLSCSIQNSTVNAASFMAVDVSGASTVAAADAARTGGTSATANANLSTSAGMLIVLTAGSNTFTPKYRVTAGTGSFGARRVMVLSF